jgi:hypothetical protein
VTFSECVTEEPLHGLPRQETLLSEPITDMISLICRSSSVETAVAEVGASF